MSAQAIARFSKERTVCPKCGLVKDVFTLRLDLDGRVGRLERWREGCSDCLQLGEKVQELKETVRIQDVMDTQTTARRRETRRLTNKREHAAAKDIGGSAVTGSGAGESKGDARNALWMVEDKFTTGKSYKLQRTILSKAVSQANQTGRKPVLKVGLADGTELAVCLWDDMKEVIREDNTSS